jgi:hypothetical protein
MLLHWAIFWSIVRPPYESQSFPIHPPVLSSCSRDTSSEAESSQYMSLNLAAPQRSLTSPKTYDMGSNALLSLLRRAYCGNLNPLKIHTTRSGLNPRTLGPMTSSIAALKASYLLGRLLPSNWNLNIYLSRCRTL